MKIAKYTHKVLVKYSESNSTLVLSRSTITLILKPVSTITSTEKVVLAEYEYYSPVLKNNKSLSKIEFLTTK